MKYRLISVLFAIYFLLVTVSANAQIGIGPEIGFNISGLKSNGDANANDIRFTGKIGAILEVPLDSNHFYLQPGLFYSMQGESRSAYVSANNYLLVPVNVLYKFKHKGESRIFVGLGVYGGYAVADRLSSAGGNHEKMPIGNAKTDDLKPFDFGASVRVGHELRNGLFVAGQYSMGFLDTYPGSEYNVKNWVISITGGYTFPVKRKKEIYIPTTF